MFCTYAFLTRPDLFESYIASDPSYWYGDQFIVALARERLKTFTGSNKTLFIGGRAGQPYKDMGIDGFVRMLRAHAPANVHWLDMAYADEHHGSVRLKDFYDGLRFTYFGLNKDLLEIHPMNGMLERNKPIILRTYTDNTNIRYTLDGTEPSRESARMSFRIPIRAPADLKIRLFGNRGNDQIFTGKFLYGSIVPLSKKPINVVQGELRYKYYQVDWSGIQDFSQISETRSGTVSNSDFWVHEPSRALHFGAVFEGFLEIRTEGYYTFYLGADDVAKFYLGGRLLLEFESGRNRFDTESFVVPLKRGFYPIRMEYLQKEQRRWVDLKYKTPTSPDEKAPTKIPAHLLYRTN